MTIGGTVKWTKTYPVNAAVQYSEIAYLIKEELMRKNEITCSTQIYITHGDDVARSNKLVFKPQSRKEVAITHNLETGQKYKKQTLINKFFKR